MDRGTLGCLIVAKTNQWHAQLLTQFFLRRVEKTYDALVYTASCGLGSVLHVRCVLVSGFGMYEGETESKVTAILSPR